MKLKTYLDEVNMPPARLADAMGVPASTISRILSGDRRPGLDLMVKIMRATEGRVTPNDFVPDDESERAEN